MASERKICLCMLLWAALAIAPARAEEGPGPGYVDGAVFLELFGEDSVTLEVSISRSLIKIMTAAHPDLKELAGGLESIHAVVIEAAEPAAAERARKAIREIDRRLAKQGWDRVARVRERTAEVKVLVLNDDESIQGLVVMVVDPDEGEVVFVNIAGRLNLEAIQKIGGGLKIPGLENIDID